MDYSKQIFEMLGVEPNEEFLTEFVKGDISTCKLDEDLRLLIKFNYGTSVEWWPSGNLRCLLNGEAKIIKIPKPTKEEQIVIDYARLCGCKWLAKDEDGNVYGYKEKPCKDEFSKSWKTVNYDYLVIDYPLSFLNWKDSEPFYIGD